MSNLIIEKLLAKTQRTDIPAFHPGDTVRVHVKIKEGDKERLQAFEGVVIKRDNGPQASFTVRKISFGQGVERIFPIHSKVIDKIDLLRSEEDATKVVATAVTAGRKGRARGRLVGGGRVAGNHRDADLGRGVGQQGARTGQVLRPPDQ